MHARVPDIQTESGPDDEGLRQLLSELAGRPPVYICEPSLSRGEVAWAECSLPYVALAPDLFFELAYAFSRMRGGGDA